MKIKQAIVIVRADPLSARVVYTSRGEVSTGDEPTALNLAAPGSQITVCVRGVSGESICSIIEQANEHPAAIKALNNALIKKIQQYTQALSTSHRDRDSTSDGLEDGAPVPGETADFLDWTDNDSCVDLN